MKKEEYYKYLNSREWLLKKHELITIYLKEGWKIECKICNNTNNLRVHHASYKNVGNEILTDENIWDLIFLCDDCHKKVHFEDGFRKKHLPSSEEISPDDIESFFKYIKKLK